MLDVFLCHTGADKPWVEAFAAKLEAEAIHGRNLTVFFDKWDIDYGENILSRIEDGLKRARFLAVVMSPAFARAEWPRLEWQSQVHDDPTGKRGRILPIVLHERDPETGEPLEIPTPLTILRRFNFSNKRRFESEYAEFLRRVRGERPRRGNFPVTPLIGAPGQETPTGGPESLVSNLFPVARYPSQISSDFTPARTKREVWDTLKGKVPPFILRRGRIYFFYPHDAEDNPFRPVLAGTDPVTERPVEWLKDEDRSRWLMELFNTALREHCYHLRIRTPPGEADPFYCPLWDSKPRVFQWGPKKRTRVLSKLIQHTTLGLVGVHYAARLRFVNVGSEAYLMVEPAWFFTKDGLWPISGEHMGRLSTKWGGREKNKTVLKHVLMWGLLLANRQERISVWLGTESLDLFPVPAHTRAPAGIADDEMSLVDILSGTGGEVPDEDVNELDEVLASVVEKAKASVHEALGEDEDEFTETADEEDDGDSELELPF